MPVRFKNLLEMEWSKLVGMQNAAPKKEPGTRTFSRSTIKYRSYNTFTDSLISRSNWGSLSFSLILSNSIMFFLPSHHWFFTWKEPNISLLTVPSCPRLHTRTNQLRNQRMCVVKSSLHFVHTYNHMRESHSPKRSSLDVRKYLCKWIVQNSSTGSSFCIIYVGDNVKKAGGFITLENQNKSRKERRMTVVLEVVSCGLLRERADPRER